MGIVRPFHAFQWFLFVYAATPTTYAHYSYRPHLACFACRKTFKRRWLSDINRDTTRADSVPATCPQCQGLLADNILSILVNNPGFIGQLLDCFEPLALEFAVVQEG